MPFGDRARRDERESLHGAAEHLEVDAAGGARDTDALRPRAHARDRDRLPRRGRASLRAFRATRARRNRAARRAAAARAGASRWRRRSRRGTPSSPTRARRRCAQRRRRRRRVDDRAGRRARATSNTRSARSSHQAARPRPSSASGVSRLAQPSFERRARLRPGPAREGVSSSLQVGRGCRHRGSRDHTTPRQARDPPQSESAAILGTRSDQT